MNRVEAALNKVSELQDSIYVEAGDEGEFFARSNVSDQIGGFGVDEQAAHDDAVPECWRLGGFRWVDGKWELKGAAK
jgi:hypothetical protein